MNLEQSTTERKQLISTVIEYSDQFIGMLSNVNAFNGNGFSSEKFEIDGNAKPIQDLLSIIKTDVNGFGINAASGGHLGYIPGGGIYTAALGDYMAAVANNYAGVAYACPGAVVMENALINWAGKLIGYTQSFGGNLTSGGSIANLIALSAAKTAKKIKSKNVCESVIYTTSQSHHSILKGLRLLGLDECVLRTISLDDNFRMNVAELEKQIIADKKNKLNPFLIIANAGSTNVGAIDPLTEIVDVAKKENLWLHVDAAYGGFFMLTEAGKQKMKGIEQADSVILDPHKSLFLPYGSGMVLVKNVQYLLEANSYNAAYMQDTKNANTEYSPAELSPELSKHFRGMRMWLPLQLHGTKPFEDCLNEKLALTNYFCEEIKKIGFELGNTPDLTVAIYRFNPVNSDREAYNKAILKHIHDDGRVFISSTEIDSEFWLRIAILSFRTHQREVDILLETLGNFVQSSTK